MARTRGIGDLIPARGEGRALVEIKGHVGGKGASMRRSDSKAKRREQVKPENSQWVPFYGFQQDLSPLLDGDSIPVPATGATRFPNGFSIGPTQALYDVEAALGLPSIQGRAVKLLRFKGNIHVLVGRDEGADPAVQNPRRLMMWRWVRVQVTPAQSVVTLFGASSAWELMAATLESDNFSMRRDVLGEGSMVLQTVQSQVVSGDNLNPYIAWTKGPGIWQDPINAKIPFPRLPKGGMRFTQDQVLVLFVACVHLDEAGNMLDAPNISGGQIGVNIVPMFRYLVTDE